MTAKTVLDTVPVAAREALRLLKLGDPRDDLPGDSELWLRLFRFAATQAREQHGLFFALWGMRCMGMRLERDGARWRLRPTIGPEGFETGAAYREARERHLVPLKRDIERALDELAAEESGLGS